MPLHPYGTLPGEAGGSHAHVPKRVWFLLHKDPKFRTNWHSPHLSRPHHLVVSCITRGVPEDQMVTIIRLWHQKHGHVFYETDFLSSVYRNAADYATPIAMKYQAEQFWKEVRRIQSDPKARQHAKLRVSYYLMNGGAATAKEIHERTGIPLKTVRNCLLALQDDGKVESKTYGVYEAVESFFWDKANTGLTEGGDTFSWDDEHPAMYSFAPPNESVLGPDGIYGMRCYDYCQDRFATVMFDADQWFSAYFRNFAECEWTINSEGDIVENGRGPRYSFISLFAQFETVEIVGHINGNKLDFRKANLKVIASRWFAVSTDSAEDDFFARLSNGAEMVAHQTVYI